jgi:flagellar basal-body rod modification protein FlgD
MVVNSATSPSQSVVTQSRTDAEKATLNYDAFLKLLLQQLKSQDPTNPVDQAQSLAQLATFSNVEQSIKINEKLAEIMNRSSAAEGAALIGKTVQSLTTGSLGVVKSVEVRTSGVNLILQSGDSIDLAGGVRISES